MGGSPAVSKRDASRIFIVLHKVMPACFRHARAQDPHVARSTWVTGKRSGRNSGRGKIRTNCPRTVLGLAQQHVALMYGPGPGAPVGVQK